MPSTGMPSSYTAGVMVGAPGSYTDDGPPDSTMPVGLSARSWRSSGSVAIVYGWISQYTACSRIRRAISWVYCEPKSRTRISWCAMSFHAVVGGFLRDDHVVDVALAQARRRDLHE